MNEGDVTAAAGKVSAGAKAVREDTEALTKAEADQWRATGNRLRNMLQNLPGIQQCVSASLFHLSSLERYTRF